MSENSVGIEYRILEVLQQILKWTKVTSIPHVRQLLSETLADDKEKLAYHYSDGRGSVEVAQASGYKAHSAVVRLWEKWARLGIVEPIKVKGGERYRRVFSLEDFGIQLPAEASAQETPREH